MRSALQVISVMTIATIVASCGAAHPFQRGQKVAAPQNQLDKPGSGTTSPGSGNTGGGTIDEPGALTAQELFAQRVRPKLVESCMGCHEGSFVSDSLEADYAAVKAKITPGNAASSAIFQYAQGGENHPGGEIWAADAPEMIELKAWIESES